MSAKCHSPRASLYRNEQGNFTIEASMLFPIIFLITIMFIFFSLYVYQKVSLYYAATTAAERIAHNWDNSKREPITGKYAIDAQHGGKENQLYWRLFDDNATDSFVFLMHRITGSVNSDSDSGLCQIPNEGTNVSLPTGKGGSGLVQQKINKYASANLSYFQGNINYQNKIVDRKITVCLQTQLKLPSFVASFLGNGIVKQQAIARIAEPAEFMRTVDFATYFTERLTYFFVERNKVHKPGKVFSYTDLITVFNMFTGK
ncbi:pilus assembly protein [Paenibacillus sp. ACRRX]|uniref:TadE/TadG family type IV pilus assembly protein n=1 Tax=unclassified Paenibacillus TaxID=185978 RepID=UPI001EF4AC99|nr:MULTISPECIES: TadE family protein [unclassified Paenibacillus]MCG7409157.1 pilus assembly protein [Paenibacillus sp. ACRRX]MDK8181849.1 pilus assembly protein [Paenibacillus sp. UMB4589-SE434]